MQHNAAAPFYDTPRGTQTGQPAVSKAFRGSISTRA